MPLRSGSVRAIGCLKLTSTLSLPTGPGQVSRVTGVSSDANAVAGLAAFVALTWSGCVIAYVPLTRWPVAVGLGSLTVRVASPALLVTVAAIVAV